MAVYNINGTDIDVSSPFVNVIDDYGATGDGTTDDASAIQDALDSLSSTGGMIYFPYGTYLITEPVLFYSNQTLLFEHGATILQGADITSLMRNYSTTSIGGYDGTHDSQIIGATFDGGSYTTNNTLLGFCHSKNITVKDCTFKNAYGTWHDLEVNSSQYVLIENCNFSGSRKTGESGENLQFDVAGKTTYYPWGDIMIDNTICQYIEVKGCNFYENTVSPAIGNHSSASHEYVRIHDCTFDTNTGSRGAINFVACVSVDCYNNTFNSCTTCFTTSNTSGQHTFHDNRVDGATTVCSDSYTTLYNNYIDGTLTE